MRVALAQILAAEDPEANLARVGEWAERAAAEDAHMVVFPEAAMASFTIRSSFVAQPLDGPFAAGIRHWARCLGVTLVVGMFTPGSARPSDGATRARNTLLMTGPDGEVTYDKIHLFDAGGFEESRHVEAGTEPVAYTVSGMRFGLATCYDVRFPALFTWLAGLGAEAIILPASWAGGPGKVDQWRDLCRARAMDATAWVVGVDQADPASVQKPVRPGSPTGVGHSLVVDPWGRVVAEAGGSEELLLVDVDAQAVAEARRTVPVLENGRFGLIAPTGETRWRGQGNN